MQEAREKEHGAYQMKLKGNPWWTSSGDQINYSRMLACSILSAMESQGFELLGSVDMSMAGGENQSERKSSHDLLRSMTGCIGMEMGRC